MKTPVVIAIRKLSPNITPMGFALGTVLAMRLLFCRETHVGALILNLDRQSMSINVVILVRDINQIHVEI